MLVVILFYNEHGGSKSIHNQDPQKTIIILLYVTFAGSILYKVVDADIKVNPY